MSPMTTPNRHVGNGKKACLLTDTTMNDESQL